MAHFRRHETTTSSLSYTFPPRTTIVGMIAAILGYEKDSYYKLFNTEKCRIALQIKNRIKHITQTLNYLMTKEVSLKRLRGIGRPTQIHTDLLLADNDNLSELSYRIFFNHEDETMQRQLEESIINRKFYYPPSLGSANNLARLEYIDTIKAEIFRPEGEIEVHTIIPKSALKNLNSQQDRRICIEDIVPADFNADRRLLRTETYIYEISGKKINASLNLNAFRYKINGEDVIGVFM